jgi:hypothetical protein
MFTFSKCLSVEEFRKKVSGSLVELKDKKEQLWLTFKKRITRRMFL